MEGKERERRSKRERLEKGELELVQNEGKKGDGLMKKNGRKFKQSELYTRLKTGGEINVNEGDVSEVVGVKFSEPEACTEG
jgi:hypothetical protein